MEFVVLGTPTLSQRSMAHCYPHHPWHGPWMRPERLARLLPMLQSMMMAAVTIDPWVLVSMKSLWTDGVSRLHYFRQPTGTLKDKGSGIVRTPTLLEREWIKKKKCDEKSVLCTKMNNTRSETTQLFRKRGRQRVRGSPAYVNARRHTSPNVANFLVRSTSRNVTACADRCHTTSSWLSNVPQRSWLWERHQRPGRPNKSLPHHSDVIDTQ